EADGVAAARPQVDQPVDPPRGGDHEVGADIGQLAELRVRHIRGEGVVDGPGGFGPGNVLDDHPPMAQPPGVFAVMALRIRGHLVLPFRAEWDQPFPDRWLWNRGDGTAAGRGGDDAVRDGKAERDGGDPGGSLRESHLRDSPTPY